MPGLDGVEKISTAGTQEKRPRGREGTRAVEEPPPHDEGHETRPDDTRRDTMILQRQYTNGEGRKERSEAEMDGHDRYPPRDIASKLPACMHA